jgi:hypothetical protein
MMRELKASEKHRQVYVHRMMRRRGDVLSEAEEARYIAQLAECWDQMSAEERADHDEWEAHMQESAEQERAADARLQPCPECADKRALGLWSSAQRCHGCKGTGITRVRQSYVCNQCGGSLCLDESRSHFHHAVPHGLVEQTVSGGYESDHLSDCTTYTFSMCERCLRTLFDAFKVPPTIGSYMVSGNTTYAEDADWYRFKIWRDAGGQLDKLRTGKCNAKQHCDKAQVWRHMLSGHLTVEATCDEHKIEYANSHNVPVDAIKGVPYERERRTTAERRQLADALLAVIVTDRGRPTYLRFVGDAVLDLFPDADVHNDEARHNGWSGMFFPGPWFGELRPDRHATYAPWFVDTRYVFLPGGTIAIRPNGGFDEQLNATPATAIARPERW